MFAPCDSRMNMISNGAVQSRPGCIIRGAPIVISMCVCECDVCVSGYLCECVCGKGLIRALVIRVCVCVVRYP